MSKPKRKKITETRTPVNIEEMSLYSLCRWAALKDAVDIIGDKCDEKSVDFDTMDIQPLDVFKYVEIATDTLFNKFQQPVEHF